MSQKITKPQSVLMGELAKAGNKGVFKMRTYTPAEMLVSEGLAKWIQKHSGGTGVLVLTESGKEFLGLPA